MSEKKTPEPKVENIVNEILAGEMQKNALDFIAFLRGNDFYMEFNPNEYEKGKWSGAIGGVVGDSIAYMFVSPGTKFPCPWNIWLNEYDFNCDGSADDEELKEFIWANLNHCGKCNPDWEKCRGGDKTVFGRKFDSLCHSPMFFYTPDAQKLEKIKKLFLKIKQKRDSTAVPI